MSPADLGGDASVTISGTGLSETSVVTEKAGGQSWAPMALPRPGWGTWLGHLASLATVPSPVRLKPSASGPAEPQVSAGPGTSQPPLEPSERGSCSCEVRPANVLPRVSP